jgi:hypothetical protein
MPSFIIACLALYFIAHHARISDDGPMNVMPQFSHISAGRILRRKPYRMNASASVNSAALIMAFMFR